MLTNKIGDFGGGLAELSALGEIPGSLSWNKFGAGTVTTAFSTVYTPGANPGLYEYMDFPQVVGVASTDPDDNATGAGANVVVVSGLCEDGCLHDEAVYLDGQNPVLTTTIFSRIFRVMNVSREGHDLQGQLYVGPGTGGWIGGEPSQILAHVNDGYNQTQMAMYTVPKDYSLFVYNVVLTTPRDREVEMAVFARDADVKDLSKSGVMAIKINWYLENTNLAIPLPGTPFIFPELTDFEFRAKAPSTSKVTANATGILIPNKYL